MIMVSNENGEVTFNVNETGEYNLQIITPEAQEKSISEQGVKGNLQQRIKELEEHIPVVVKMRLLIKTYKLFPVVLSVVL